MWRCHEVKDMKKSDILTIVAVIAIILTALCFNIYALFALIIFFAILIWRILKKKDEEDIKGLPKLLTIEEATKEYGEPDADIIADATRANESAGCILVYKQRRVLIVAGEPVSMDDITDVTSVNTATPYTVGQYQVVLTTKRPGREYIRMNVGLDADLARDVAMQIIDAIK